MIDDISMNSYWKYAVDESDVGEREKWHLGISAVTEDIWVPSCWNELKEELFEYVGAAWYEKRFVYREKPGIKRNVLFFSGVNYQCKVWLNGRLVGEHVGGFSPFEFDVTQYLLLEKENLLVLRVDNTLGDMTIPPVDNDWFNYGGIYREVNLYGTGESWIEDITVITKMDGNVRIMIDTGNFTNGDEYHVDIEVYDPEEKYMVIDTCAVLTEPKSVIDIQISDAKLWSPDNSFMYDFNISLKKSGNTMDNWKHLIGIREYSIKERRILLNGTPIMLRGYSKHEDYPMHGRTFCKDTVRKDYEICKRGNANFVRMCHYPHDLKEYRIASEMGFLIIAEVPNLNFKEEQFVNKDLQQLAVVQLKELIKYYKNETCIMFWSLFLECATMENSAVEFVSSYIDLCKKLDPSRFTIHASFVPLDDRTYDYFDVIGVNYWNGWYNGDTLDGGSIMLDRIASRYPDKPIVMTSGGWEAIYGCHSYKANIYWSEEKQAEYLDKLTEMYIGKDYIAGEIVWTFNDFRVSKWIKNGKPNWLVRPMGINSKGVVDYYRRPKLSYYKLQETFKKWDEKLKKSD